MKLLHVCFVGPYNEGWTYQENLLSKYHVHLGYEVTLLCIPKEFVKGKIQTSKDTEYVNENGVHVIRMREKLNLANKLVWYKNVEQMLYRIEPDIIFVHGCQFMDAPVVAKYVKEHTNVKMYVDNHCDYSNSATNILSKNVLHKFFWRRCAKALLPLTEKFYGVLPARVDFLTELYGIPKEKCELLVMGADDEFVIKARDLKKCKLLREKYNIRDNDFLIMTGGKIDLFKTQTLLLMQAVKNINNPQVKLIVFGSVAPELEDRIKEMSNNEYVQFVGWIDANDSYQMFATADLVVFPGRHSVFWEQVVGQGIPMVVKYWDGTTHVDCGGNVEFLYKDSEEEIQNKIEEIIFTNKYSEMKKAAEMAKNKFVYSEIARKSIDSVEK